MFYLAGREPPTGGGGAHFGSDLGLKDVMVRKMTVSHRRNELMLCDHPLSL